MPLPIYMDVHVPFAITAGLRRRGVHVLTSQDDESILFPDDQLLERATELNRVLFSQDDDMLALASQWQHEGKTSSGVIYGHQLSAGIATLVNDLELVLKCCAVDEVRNAVIYLPLS